MASKHELSAAEKYLVVQAYGFFKRKVAENRTVWKGTARSHVKDCLGFSTSTVSRIMTHWNAHHDLNFASMTGNRTYERTNKITGEFNLYPLIREVVLTRNKDCRPVTAQIVCGDIKKLVGIEHNARTMRRTLHKMGMRFIQGHKRNILAEKDVNVAFRASYLLKVSENHNDDNDPIRPEVYLDESYCNLNHVSGKTWVDEDKQRNTKSGRGQRMCIVGAGVIKRDCNKITASFVDGSLRMWPFRIKPKRGEEDDYHGNFTVDLFERWFSKLCTTLKEQFGPCVIHLDGASYHKRVLHPIPTTRNTKAEIQGWLLKKGVEFSERAIKAELLVLMKNNRPEKVYRANQIALEKNGHTLFYTPPYHPELQPIELVWGQVKNAVALNPASSMVELKEKLVVLFDSVTSSNWTKAYRKVQHYEGVYKNRQEDCLLADSSDNDDIGADADDGSDEDADMICSV